MTSEKNDLIRIRIELAPIRLAPDLSQERPMVIWTIPLDCVAFDSPWFLVPNNQEEDQGDDSL